jgi:hypothetical protein
MEPIRVGSILLAAGPDTWKVSLISIEAVRKLQWFKDSETGRPSMAVLLGVVLLWALGAVGGLAYLSHVSSLMVMLTGLYVGLAAVVVSIAVATLAANDLVVRYYRPRTRP